MDINETYKKLTGVGVLQPKKTIQTLSKCVERKIINERSGLGEIKTDVN